MPYLHWETDFNRGQCTQAVKRMQNMRAHSDGLRTSKSQDENLIRGYLNSSTDLHLRRTLDQFKHHSINTEKRDRDQVVFRYCDKAKKPLKIFMVDQLWMWILDDSKWPTLRNGERLGFYQAVVVRTIWIRRSNLRLPR